MVVKDDASVAEEAFAKFDWSNPAWLAYYDNTYPTPPLHRVDRYKRKWFRANVNSGLSLTPPSSSTADASAPQSTSATGASTATCSSPTQTPSSAPKMSARTSASPVFFNKLELASQLAMALGCIFSALYLLPIAHALMPFFSYAMFCFLLGFLLDVGRRHGTPKMSLDYLQSCLMDEAGQTLFVTVASISLKSCLCLASPVITSVLLLCEAPHVWKSLLPQSLSRDPRIGSIVQNISAKRYTAMKHRANIEVAVGFSTIGLLFMRRATFMTVILYWNALRFKHQVNPFTQAVFRDINGMLTRLTLSPHCPSVVRSGYAMIRSQLEKMTYPAERRTYFIRWALAVGPGEIGVLVLDHGED